MTRLLKTTFIAAAVLIGPSAFAETYLNEMGTGDVHPIILQSAPAFVASSRRAAPAYVGSTGRGGLAAYAMVGQNATRHDPEFTGGGSRGYNENLSIY
jgi:hypothetical protein